MTLLDIENFTRHFDCFIISRLLVFDFASLSHIISLFISSFTEIRRLHSPLFRFDTFAAGHYIASYVSRPCYISPIAAFSHWWYAELLIMRHFAIRFFWWCRFRQSSPASPPHAAIIFSPLFSPRHDSHWCFDRFIIRHTLRRRDAIAPDVTTLRDIAIRQPHSLRRFISRRWIASSPLHCFHWYGRQSIFAVSLSPFHAALNIRHWHFRHLIDVRWWFLRQHYVTIHIDYYDAFWLSFAPHFTLSQIFLSLSHFFDIFIIAVRLFHYAVITFHSVSTYSFDHFLWCRLLLLIHCHTRFIFFAEPRQPLPISPLVTASASEWRLFRAAACRCDAAIFRFSLIPPTLFSVTAFIFLLPCFAIFDFCHYFWLPHDFSLFSFFAACHAIDAGRHCRHADIAIISIFALFSYFRHFDFSPLFHFIFARCCFSRISAAAISEYFRLPLLMTLWHVFRHSMARGRHFFTCRLPPLILLYFHTPQPECFLMPGLLIITSTCHCHRCHFRRFFSLIRFSLFIFSFHTIFASTIFHWAFITSIYLA